MTGLASMEIDPKTFLRDHCTLPALPEVVSKIQTLIHDDHAHMATVADLISGEPALVAQVLKVVNSAYYGLSREIGNVKFAIAFLGLNEIYRMVLALSVVNTLAIDEKDQLNKFWFHSFYTALCTRYLAKRYEPHFSFEELWSAAMLHDIGKLVCLKFFPDHYKTLRRFCDEQHCLFSQAEKHFSVPSTAFLGSLLCEHWRLPDNIRSACESHTVEDLPSLSGDTPSARFRRMICLGNLLSVLSADPLNNDAKYQIASAIQTELDCTEQSFLAMMGDIYELRIEVEKFADQLH
jgi:HD-like signal output (HDOD) protein